MSRNPSHATAAPERSPVTAQPPAGTAVRDASTASADAPPGFRPGVILAFVCLGQFMVFLDVSIVNLALPSIQRGLSLSSISLNYIVTAYATVLGGFLLLCGRLADTFGRRKLLQGGFAVFALSSLGSALSQNGASLITFRGFQGLGSAMIATAALSILTSTFPEGAARNKALGIWGSLTGIASIFGVILGGVLADGPGWRWIFWINVPIGLIAAAVAPRLVPDSTAGKRRHRFDFSGAVMLTSALLLLIFTLGEATRVGWGTTRTIGSLVGVAVLLAAFLLNELKVKAPLIPLQIFGLKTMRIANLSAVLVYGMFSALFFFCSIFMQIVYGYSPLKAGFAYVPLAICVATGAGIASGVITKVAPRPVLIAGLLGTVAGLFLLWRAPVGGGYLVDLLPAFLVLGVGVGMCYVTLQIAAFVGISGETAGIGAGLINTSQEAGGALGLAVVATIAYNGITSKIAATHGNSTLIQHVQATANHHAFLSAAGFGLAALLLAIFLLPRGKASEEALAVTPTFETDAAEPVGRATG
jgi:EmrB/QacA subfamily drug resistance transporter